MRRLARRRVLNGGIDGCQKTGAADLQRKRAIGRGHEAHRYQGAERQRHQQQRGDQLTLGTAFETVAHGRAGMVRHGRMAYYP